MLALHRFRKGLKGRVVKNFATTWLLDRLGLRLGFGVTTTPIGFKWIKEELLKGDTSLGGEESGGVGIPEHLPERDGLLAGLLLLESVGATGKPLEEQFREAEILAGPTHAYDRLDLLSTARGGTTGMRGSSWGAGGFGWRSSPATPRRCSLGPLPGSAWTMR